MQGACAGTKVPANRCPWTENAGGESMFEAHGLSSSAMEVQMQPHLPALGITTLVPWGCQTFW